MKDREFLEEVCGDLAVYDEMSRCCCTQQTKDRQDRLRAIIAATPEDRETTDTPEREPDNCPYCGAGEHERADVEPYGECVSWKCGSGVRPALADSRIQTQGATCRDRCIRKAEEALSQLKSERDRINAHQERREAKILAQAERIKQRETDSAEPPPGCAEWPEDFAQRVGGEGKEVPSKLPAGMTLRDHFAVAATDADIEAMRYDWQDPTSGKLITRFQARYIHADGMLATRKLPRIKPRLSTLPEEVAAATDPVPPSVDCVAKPAAVKVIGVRREILAKLGASIIATDHDLWGVIEQWWADEPPPERPNCCCPECGEEVDSPGDLSNYCSLPDCQAGPFRLGDLIGDQTDSRRHDEINGRTTREKTPTPAGPCVVGGKGVFILACDDGSTHRIAVATDTVRFLDIGAVVSMEIFAQMTDRDGQLKAIAVGDVAAMARESHE